MHTPNHDLDYTLPWRLQAAEYSIYMWLYAKMLGGFFGHVHPPPYPS